MRLHAIVSVVTLLLSGCAFNVSKYGQTDPREKSITLPRGGDDVTRILKDTLVQNGWRIYTWTDAVKTTGTGGQHVDLRSSAYGQARYSLNIVSVRYLGMDMKVTATIASLGLMCPVLLEPSIHDLNLSVVDNKSGQELLTITGTGYTDQLKQAITKGLQ